MRPVCRHCGAEVAARPRGLGWRCYYTPGVREMYPPTSKFAVRGVGDGVFPSAVPAVPCPHPAGSEGRLATLAARAAAGEAMHHPGDNRSAVDPAACPGCGDTTCCCGGES